MRKFLLLLIPLALALGSERFTEDFRYSYPLAPGGRISLENFNGSVEITGSDRPDVEITGTKFADSRELLSDIRIDVAASGNTIRVRTIRPEGRWRGDMGARYLLRVPKRCDLDEISTSNGGIRVEDVEGRTRLQTSNGSVKTLRVRGDVDVHTSNGAVEAEEISGSLEAATSNGAIRARLAGYGQPVHLKTSNGGVELNLDGRNAGDVRATTSNGAITLRMPSSAGARIKAVTSSHNRVSSDFDITMRGTISPHHVEGTIGGGGPMIELTTSNGGIRLLRQ